MPSEAPGTLVEAARLDLHEGIATPPDPRVGGCTRWPEHLRLLNLSTGEFLPGMCRATRKCHYCGVRGAVENAEMVALDACEFPPSLFCVLTTRDPFMPSSAVRHHLRAVSKSLRKRWPEFQYACFVEFTTGLSVFSGGHRRIHLNLLVKGVPSDDSGDLHDALLATWGRRTNTTQLHVGPIYAAEGLVRYVTNLALHVMKDGQKPPAGYPGHLVRWSRGYYASGATATRERARDSLKLKRLLHSGSSLEDAQLELQRRALFEWQLIHVDPSIERRPLATQRQLAAA